MVEENGAYSSIWGLICVVADIIRKMTDRAKIDLVVLVG